MEKYYVLIPISKWNENNSIYWMNINEFEIQFLEYLRDLLRDFDIYIHIISDSIFFLSFELERSVFKSLLTKSFQSKKRKHQIENLINSDGIQRIKILKTYLNLIPGFLFRQDDYESILNCFLLDSMKLILKDLYPFEPYTYIQNEIQGGILISKDYFKNPTQLLPNSISEHSQILNNLLELLPILYRKPILDKEIFALVTQKNLKFLTHEISLKSSCKWNLFDILSELTKYTNFSFKMDLKHFSERLWDRGCIEFHLSPTFEKLKRWIYSNRFENNEFQFKKSKEIINKIDHFSEKLWHDVFFKGFFHNTKDFTEYLLILYPTKTGIYENLKNKNVQSICIPQFLLQIQEENENEIQKSPLLCVFHDLQFLTLLTYEMQFAGFIPSIPKEKIKKIIIYILDRLKPFIFIQNIDISLILKTIETTLIFNSWIHWISSNNIFEISCIYSTIRIENLTQIIIQSILYWCTNELSFINNIIKKRGKKFETLYSTLEHNFKTKEEILEFMNTLTDVNDKKIILSFLNAIPFKSIDHEIKINETDVNRLKLIDLNYFNFSFSSEIELYNDICESDKTFAKKYLQSKNMRLPKQNVYKFQIFSEMTPYRIEYRNLNSIRFDANQHKKWFQQTFSKIFKQCEKGEIMDSTIKKKFKSNLPIWKWIDSNKTTLYISSHYCLYFLEMETELKRTITNICLKLMEQGNSTITYVQSSSFSSNETKKIFIVDNWFREENRLIPIQQKDKDILLDLFGESIGIFRKEVDESIRLPLNQSIDDLIQTEFLELF